MRMNLAKRGAVLGCLLLFYTQAAIGQDAAAILRTALDRYEQSVAGVDDYTVTYSFMGQEHSSYMQKQVIDGHSVFLPHDGDDGGERQWENPYRLFPKLAERARVVGTETIDGVHARGLRIDDFEGMEFGMKAGLQGEFEPRSLTLWIGTREYLIRKMDIEGVGIVNGQERPIVVTAWMRDYRTVEGMPYPFRTTIRTKGMLGSGGSSSHEAAEAQAQLEELDRQMAQLPAEQRAMMERMMGGQLEELRNMVGSGELEIELEVTDLVVNTGQPADSQDG